MLVDLPDWLYGPKCRTTALLAKAKAENPDFEFEFYKPERMAKGVYASFTLEHDLSMAGIKTNCYPFTRWMREQDMDERMRIIMEDMEKDMPHDYGVCDNFEQLLARWPQIESDEREFVLMMSPITREGSPGWRWHKNGTYIGTQEPRAEHFGDEPVIEQVWAFRIIHLESIPVVA